MAATSPISLAVADNHTLFRKGLVELIHRFEGIKVILEASNGKELMTKFSKSRTLPDICLLDISMPEMDGFETMEKIRDTYPDMKVLAVTMYDNEHTIIRMLRKGASGYLVKTSDPVEVKKAIYSIYKTGYYHSEIVNGKLHYIINHSKNGLHPAELSEKEIELLRYCCTDMTYAEIAQKMNNSTRTIEGYRDKLFEKLGINSRPGLVYFAVKTGLVNY